MLGSVCERKNQMTAIRAVEYCHTRGRRVMLTIAEGDGSVYAQECRRYILEKGLSEFIHIAGFHSDISPLLRENDCYLCASTDESFPGSIVEALTYDLTIISTPVAGVPELLSDKYNLYIYARDMRRQMLQRVFRNVLLIMKMAISGRFMKMRLLHGKRIFLKMW